MSYVLDFSCFWQHVISICVLDGLVNPARILVWYYKARPLSASGYEGIGWVWCGGSVSGRAWHPGVCAVCQPQSGWARIADVPNFPEVSGAVGFFHSEGCMGHPDLLFSYGLIIVGGSLWASCQACGSLLVEVYLVVLAVTQTGAWAPLESHSSSPVQGPLLSCNGCGHSVWDTIVPLSTGLALMCIRVHRDRSCGLWHPD